MGNTKIGLRRALQDIAGVYVYDGPTLSMRWVELRNATTSKPGSDAERYRLLAEFAFREHALAEKAYAHVGRPDYGLAARILVAHLDDPDLSIRARQFHRRFKLYWSQFGMRHDSDDTLPPV